MIMRRTGVNNFQEKVLPAPTSQPWQFIEGATFLSVQGDRGETVLLDIQPEKNREQKTADYKRIVACVNACAGLSQDALDGNWTAAGISAYAKGLEDKLAEFSKQPLGNSSPEPGTGVTPAVAPAKLPSEFVIDERGNCSVCGGTHYGSSRRKCPLNEYCAGEGGQNPAGQPAKPPANMEDLAMLLRRLIHAIDSSPDGRGVGLIATSARDYLKRHGLDGSPMR